jgi:hypothetical protein
MQINFHGPEWQALAAWATAERERLRGQNDNVDLSPEHTAALRGELRFIKKLLALPEKAARAKGAGSAKSPFGGIEA